MSRVRTFLSELKKRHVYRVAVVYGVVAWFVVQAASIVVPELALPSWITRAIIVVSVLGFPIAVVLAWAYDITSQGVQRTGSTETPGTDVRPAATRSRRLRHAVVVAGVLLVTVVGVTTYAIGTSDRRVLRGDELLEELRTLSDAGRYAEAFDVAQRAIAEGESVPDTVSGRFTDRLTVVSDPPGARVTVLRLTPASRQAFADGPRTDMGVTPLRGVPIVRGDYHVRVEAEGYAPVERPASGAQWRQDFRSGGEAEVRLEVRLLPLEQAVEGMVYVPGGRYQIASLDMQSLTAELDDYFIDRLEVTNARFAEFVDAGGYARQELWSDLAEAMGAGAADVHRTFVDRTKLPAPRGWSGQQPPRELVDHPVTGVSWYEAAAYCRFRGGRLPTLFEWERAARDGAYSRQGIGLPWGYVGPHEPATDRANFDGNSTTPAGAYPFGVSAYGALDMAGNAKEWLFNRSESGRAVTGGSYADPVYVFSEMGSMDAAAAIPTVGFRCARMADGASAAGRQGDGPLQLMVEAPVYEPVDERTFRTLLSHYHYDPRPLEPVIEERDETAVWTRERITYNGPAGERVIAYLFLPASGRPPYQTIVNVPSSAAFFGNHTALLAEESLGPLVRAGRAVFTVVMKGMTERPYPSDFERPASNSVAFRDMMVLHATELRLGLDYLATRDDIDMDALAYVGTSWGAGSRLVLAGVDDRFRAIVLVGAGIDERLHPTLPEALNVNFAPYIRAPKLVVNGLHDEEHPWRTRAEPLWNLLSEPKELALFEGVGHIPPDEMRIPAIRDFLDRHLGTR